MPALLLWMTIAEMILPFQGKDMVNQKDRIPTYRMFGMDTSEIFLYHSKCSRPTYQWIVMMKMIIIDAQYVS